MLGRFRVFLHECGNRIVQVLSPVLHSVGFSIRLFIRLFDQRDLNVYY